jgi:hypothetical protein
MLRGAIDRGASAAIRWEPARLRTGRLIVNASRGFCAQIGARCLAQRGQTRERDVNRAPCEHGCRPSFEEWRPIQTFPTGSTAVKAAVVTELGRPLSVREVPVPELGPGQVLVRIQASVCVTPTSMPPRLMGAIVVVAVDIEDSKLELARELGADHVVNGHRGPGESRRRFRWRGWIGHRSLKALDRRTPCSLAEGVPIAPDSCAAELRSTPRSGSPTTSRPTVLATAC